jgi:16S rRNA (uracil1498-N3)-methyltransferase
MPRFFIRQTQIDRDKLILVGDDAHHIARALRMAVGDRVVVCDMQRKEYLCELTAFSDDSEVLARIVDTREMHTEPPFYARLYQALPKGDKLDTVIQKAVECGASEITPFESERCVARSKTEQEQKKTDRRCRIAAEAAKQCGRGMIPVVNPTCRFEEMLHRAKDADIPLFCYEGEGTISIKEALRTWLSEADSEKLPTVSLVIGSEGGFSLAEAEMARQMGFLVVGLGSRILRTETAAPFVLATLVYELEL